MALSGQDLKIKTGHLKWGARHFFKKVFRQKCISSKKKFSLLKVQFPKQKP